MERTLQVLDCAILVISGTDGVQSHTRTLWRLLERYEVPTFLFINKMDLSGSGPAPPCSVSCGADSDDGCVDFGAAPEALWEEAALCSEEAMAALFGQRHPARRDPAGT